MIRRDSPIAIQARVIYALILRDMRTRFGRSFVGYLVILGWPLSHLLFLLGLYSILRNYVPIGTNSTVFIGTGILPYILCLYPGRMIMTSVVMNRPLLGFPVIKASDLIFARAIVETITAFWVVAILCVILYLLDIDFMPNRIEDAVAAILATVYLGLALGWMGAVMFAWFKAWLGVQIALLLTMYFSSGVFFIPSRLSANLQTILYFNPLMHSVEWLRSAYYDGYGYGLLDRAYLIGYATVILVWAMTIERAIRGRLLQQ